jgi:hypothetical protein
MLTMVMKILIQEWKYFVFQNVNNGDEDTDSGMENTLFFRMLTMVMKILIQEWKKLCFSEC